MSIGLSIGLSIYIKIKIKINIYINIYGHVHRTVHRTHYFRRNENELNFLLLKIELISKKLLRRLCFENEFNLPATCL